jgi:hypothetical protein
MFEFIRRCYISRPRMFSNYKDFYDKKPRLVLLNAPCPFIHRALFWRKIKEEIWDGCMGEGISVRFSCSSCGKGFEGNAQPGARGNRNKRPTYCIVSWFCFNSYR